MNSEGVEYQDLSRLSGLVKGALWFYVGIAVVGLWSSWLELSLLQGAARGVFYSDAEAAANDSRQALVAGLYTLSYLVTSILFLRWTYVANRNARSLGAESLEFTPGWAVGWYFVPVASFWKPYQALKETFQASHPDFGADWPNAPHPKLMRSWWTLWIVSGFVANAFLRLVLSAETLEEFIVSSQAEILTGILDVPLGLVLISLISTMTGWQQRKHARMPR